MGAPCAKYVLIAVNILIWLIGVVLLAVGVFVIKPDYLKIFGDLLEKIPREVLDAIGTVGQTVGIGLCVAGGIIFLIGFLGCCGAMCENTVMLSLYAVILIVLVLGEIACGLLIFFKKDEVFNEVTKVLMPFVTGFSNDPTDAKTLAWNALQKELKCCGVYNASDWIGTEWQQDPGTSQVPYTCCVMSEGNSTVPKDAFQCQMDAGNYNKGNATESDMFYSKGCATKIREFFEEQKFMALGVAGAIVGAEMAAIGMACAVRKYAKNKGDKYMA